MKKILVTGGAGYIGSVAVKKLIEKDFSVFNFLIFEIRSRIFDNRRCSSQ